MRSPGNAGKPQIWPISLSQNSAKIRKINRPWPYTNHAVKRLQLVGWINGPMYRSKEGISGFGRTDGQPENIMPPVPKGGGIKNYWATISIYMTTMISNHENIHLRMAHPTVDQKKPQIRIMRWKKKSNIFGGIKKRQCPSPGMPKIAYQGMKIVCFTKWKTWQQKLI